MRHFPHLQRIIRAGLAGGDMVGPLAELKLALEAEARETRSVDAREAVLWLARQIRAAKGECRADGPTEETEARARLTIDPVAALHRRGRIGDAELAAIGRMRRCWKALGAGLELRASRLDGAVRDGGKRPVRDPADRMPDWLWLEIRHVFTPSAATSWSGASSWTPPRPAAWNASFGCVAASWPCPLPRQSWTTWRYTPRRARRGS
jgi:hypothetical protein